MLQEQIRQWLNSDQEFEPGVNLLEQADQSCIHIRIFRISGPTERNRQKLAELLTELLQPVKHIEAELQSSIGYPRYDFFSLPDDLQRDHIRKAELYRTAGQLHSKLSEASSDLARAEIANLIMANMEENQRCWERIDYFLQYGSTKKETKPVLPDLAGMDTLQLARFKANNASNLSKWRKKLANTQDKGKKAQLQERIVQHEKLQEEVLKLL